jgi:hypothetical protein
LLRILDELSPEPGSIYVLDRGYVDFERLYRLHRARAIFVIRAKRNLACRRIYSEPSDRSAGLWYDQTVRLTGPKSSSLYPEKLHRVRFRDPETGKAYTFLTNDFSLPSLTIANLYRSRWQV